MGKTSKSRKTAPPQAIPPKLHREIRIPVLKIERLKPETIAQETSPSKSPNSRILVDQNEEQKEEVLPPPPQLDKCAEDLEEDTTEKDKDDDEDAKSTSTNNDSGSDSNNFLSKLRKHSSSSADPKKLIQSIFAKPKKEKAKKQRKVTVKDKVKKCGQPAGLLRQGAASARYLRTRPMPSGFQQMQRRTTSRSSTEEQIEDEEVGDIDESECNSQESIATSMDSESVPSSKCDQEDDNKTEADEDRKQRRANAKEEGSDESDTESKKSDDELFEEWKPLRAAAVAAMELVAKKQVTDDLRLERRIRKHKLPPRGRGRRTILKRMQKPVKSCEETAGPFVSSSVYYDNTIFRKGDIVCLLKDIYEIKYRNLGSTRFFQVTGFLKIPLGEDCVSLKPLKRIVPIQLPKEYLINNEIVRNNPYAFNVLDYRPAELQDIMVGLSQLKFVISAPPDLYYGHDLLFNKPFSGRIYARLGNPLVEYEEEDVLNHEKEEELESSDENDVEESSEDIFDNNDNTNNSVKESEDNESIDSSNSPSSESNCNFITSDNTPIMSSLCLD